MIGGIHFCCFCRGGRAVLLLLIGTKEWRANAAAAQQKHVSCQGEPARPHSSLSPLDDTQDTTTWFGVVKTEAPGIKKKNEAPIYYSARLGDGTVGLDGVRGVPYGHTTTGQRKNCTDKDLSRAYPHAIYARRGRQRHTGGRTLHQPEKPVARPPLRYGHSHTADAIPSRMRGRAARLVKTATISLFYPNRRGRADVKIEPQ